MNEINYDFDEISIASYENQTDTCGITVIYSDKCMSFCVDKKGGSVGGICLDQNYGSKYSGTKAVCFVGGSTMGLEAVCGVNRTLSTNNNNNRIYSKKALYRALGACIYSYNLVEKDLAFPTRELGEQFIYHLKKKIKIGQIGAGKNATVGKIYPSFRDEKVYAGQGASFNELDGIKFLVITILNSIGVIHKNGNLIHKFNTSNIDIQNINQLPNKSLNYSKTNKKQCTATTLTAVVTNIKMEKTTMEKLRNCCTIIQQLLYIHMEQNTMAIVCFCCQQIQ